MHANAKRYFDGAMHLPRIDMKFARAHGSGVTSFIKYVITSLYHQMKRASLSSLKWHGRIEPTLHCSKYSNWRCQLEEYRERCLRGLQGSQEWPRDVEHRLNDSEVWASISSSISGRIGENHRQKCWERRAVE
jgi:hypothetical protein